MFGSKRFVINDSGEVSILPAVVFPTPTSSVMDVNKLVRRQIRAGMSEDTFEGDVSAGAEFDDIQPGSHEKKA